MGRACAAFVTAGLGLAACAVFVVSPASAAPGPSAAPASADERAAPGWVARFGDQTIPRRPAEALLRLARREQPALTLPELTRHLALDLLLGDAAAREVGDATLFASRRVAFAPEADTRRQWLATLQQIWPERIDRAWTGARLEQPVSVDGRAWTALWADGQGSGLRLDEALDDRQRDAASRLVLLRHRAFGGLPAGAISVADIWPLQNVQGRRMLRMGELDFARAQARQLLRERFVEQWLRRDSGWSEAELDFVRRVVQARQRKLAWVRWQGLSGDPHGDAPARAALAASVREDEIGAYYRAHLDRFTRLEAVDGLHLRCPDAACGEGSDLRGQPGVKTLAWRLGDPKPAVELDAWALDLLQAWPVGVASPAIRHPDGHGWERVQAIAVKRGHHPLDSETVRHEARQAIAQEKLEAAWRRRQRELLATADLQWAPGMSAPALPFEPELPPKGGEEHGHAH